MTTRLFAIGAAFALALSGQAFAQDTSTPAAEPAPAEQAEPAPEAAPAEAAEAVEPAAPATPATPLPEGISAPPEGMGQVIFFRPVRLVGAALSFTVRQNDEPLGRLPNGRYFVHVAEPGIHEYEIGRNDTMRMEIEPGETYYVIQQTQMGVVAGRAVIAPSDQAAFEQALPRMRLSAPVGE